MVVPDRIKISVIIPTKNRPHLLKRAMQSIAVQNYPGVEVCITDNNTDDAVSAQVQELVSQFATAYTQLRWLYVHSSKPYASGARNDGMAATTGPYIIFLDDDDELLPHSIQVRAEEMMTDNDLALLYCAGYSSIYPYPFKMYRYYHYSKQRHSGQLMMMSCSSIIINRKLFEQHHLVFDEALSRMEDYDLCRRIIQLHLKVKSIPQPLVHIHLHPETRMSSRKLIDYSFRHVLASRWGTPAGDVIYNYAEGVYIWRKCFGIEDESYRHIKSSLQQDFNRQPSLSFRIKYQLVSFSPQLFLALYHIGVSASQLFKNGLARLEKAS